MEPGAACCLRGQDLGRVDVQRGAEMAAEKQEQTTALRSTAN
jgi:hypothetical protein